MKGLDHLLSAVSRSFYLSMRFLPREMRSGVAVGYLLARATDTVADAVDMDCRERLALLRMMGETVAGCVGEFWTRLGLLAQGPGFSTQPEEQLLRWGRHYGMGLQLVLSLIHI